MKSLMSGARWLGTVATAGLLLALVPGAATAALPVPGAADVAALTAGTARSLAVGWTAPVVAVSPDGAKAYVGVIDDDGARTTVLKVVDTATGTVTTALTLSTTPGTYVNSLALGPDGTRLYAVVGSARLVTVDTAAGTVLADVPLPAQPRPDGYLEGVVGSLAVAPDGAGVYLAQAGPRQRFGARPGRVLAYSTATGAFTATIELPGDGVGSIVLRPDGADAYVTTSAGLVHLGVTPTALTVVRTFTDGHGASGSAVLSPDGGTLYGFGNSASDYTVDTATDTVTSGFHFAPGHGDLRSPVVSPDGHRVYVVSQSSGVMGPGAPYPQGPYYSSVILAYDTEAGALVPAESVYPPSVGLTHNLVLGPDGRTFHLAGNVSPSAGVVAGLDIITR
ncbi:hypothetical protein AB0E96_18310 [Kitasatospora sp. NPDC036755]|uniref:WD40 repeat domain-containing protein n=1 Tax=Kitasatospora sp. NPDC036755 TaxID=3154600 RepID=UPI0034004457